MPTTNHYRSLLRVEHIHRVGLSTWVQVAIPTWNPHCSVWLTLPEAVVNEIERSPGPDEGPTIYIFCQIEPRALYAADLHPEGPWEIQRVEFSDPALALGDWVRNDLGVRVIEERTIVTDD